jgi:hypothetical protein
MREWLVIAPGLLRLAPWPIRVQVHRPGERSLAYFIEIYGRDTGPGYPTLLDAKRRAERYADEMEELGFSPTTDNPQLFWRT